jgi:hypothetical protein
MKYAKKTNGLSISETECVGKTLKEDGIGE